MRRREALAGLAGAGVLATGGVVAVGGLPEFSAAGGSEEPATPVTIETTEAPGSESGEVTIPASGQVTFVDFFGTTCPPCERQMPDLAEAHDRVGDDVLFVSVTTEDVGGSLPEEELVEWWDDHDGNWTVGVDRQSELAVKYARGLPTAVVFDADGREHWSDRGTHSADELVEKIEAAIDA